MARRSLFSAIWSGLSAGTTQFRKEYLASSTQLVAPGRGPTYALGLDNFASYEARRFRYLLYWAYYENSAYDSIHSWALRYKSEYGLYRYTRGVYNPFNRLGEFWASRLMGGSLDPEAGDGKMVPSALPIETKNDGLRPAISRLWRDSNWQVNKDVLGRLGAISGDAVICVEDDPEKEYVSLEVVDPYCLVWASRDRWGNVRDYIREEWRIDPDFDPRYDIDSPLNQKACLYREECFRDGESVTYLTLKDGEPYAWNGREASWSIPYGFTPMVIVPHQKISPSAQWGLSEFHAALPKVREADDLGSHIHDQIRKAVWPKFLFAGVSNPALSGRTARLTGTGATDDSPEPGREEVGAIYGSSGATVTPMMYDLQLQFSSIELQNQINSLLEDYPELMFDSYVSGDASAVARREARKKAEAKVHARRAGYDDGLVRAMQMAIAIGGWRGYEGYEGYGLESYAAGDLDFRIGNRAVFNVDPMDVLEQQAATFSAAEIAVRTGYPLPLFLKDVGKSPEQIAEFEAARDEQVKRNIEDAAALAEATRPPQPEAAPVGGTSNAKE